MLRGRSLPRYADVICCVKDCAPLMLSFVRKAPKARSNTSEGRSSLDVVMGWRGHCADEMSDGLGVSHCAMQPGLQRFARLA